MGNHRNFLRPKEPTWLHLGGSRPSKIEAKTRKNRCWKTTHFWHRFLKGSDLILERFLESFWNPSSTSAHVCRKWSDVNKTPVLVVRKRHRHFCDISNFKEKSLKKCIFFGTSILEGFWQSFGRRFGGQNPRFSHFFRCFFLSFLKCGLEGETNGKKSPKPVLQHVMGLARRNVRGPGER